MNSLPLVVDLDGTFIRTELPWESFLSVLVNHPLKLLRSVRRKLIVRAACFFKLELEEQASFSLEEVPLSKIFLEYLKKEKAQGREIILCTGSTHSYGLKIQDRTDLFTSVWGSTLGTNLVGSKKAQFLVERYGEKQFDYAGNSFMDFKVALHARHFILVNPSLLTQFFLNFSRNFQVHKLFKDKHLSPLALLQTWGIPLWIVNGIGLFLPLLLVFPEVPSAWSLSWIHLNFSATAFYTFFTLTNTYNERKKKDSNNLFSKGDLSLSSGFLVSGLSLIFMIVSFILLSFFHPLSILPLLLYVPCLYLLARKKQLLVVRYGLFVSIILLQAVCVIWA